MPSAMSAACSTQPIATPHGKRSTAVVASSTTMNDRAAGSATQAGNAGSSTFSPKTMRLAKNSTNASSTSTIDSSDSVDGAR